MSFETGVLCVALAVSVDQACFCLPPLLSAAGITGVCSYLNFFVLRMDAFCLLHACLCITSVPGAQGGQRVLGPLELELQLGVSHQLGLGIQSGASGRTADAVYC